MATRAEQLPYRLSVRTSRQPEAVLSDLAHRDVAGVGVTEQGPHYVLLQDRRQRRYGPDLAVCLGIALVLAVLIGYAYHPLTIALLPVAALPALPLLFRRQGTMVAVGAVVEPDGVTRLTAHGEVSPEVAGALDAYFGALPVATTTAQPTGPPAAGRTLHR